jgi:hypothetical protein
MPPYERCQNEEVLADMKPKEFRTIIRQVLALLWRPEEVTPGELAVVLRDFGFACPQNPQETHYARRDAQADQ